MLTGIMSSAVSKYLPGPGSTIVEQQVKFILPVYHYAIVEFFFEVTSVDVGKNEIQMDVRGTDEEKQLVLEGSFKVAPPYLIETMTGKALDNF
jgi:acyl dehydratase